MATVINKSTAHIIDVLCEGRIQGPANEVDGSPDWAASTYFDEQQVRNSDGTYNIDGVIVRGRVGLDTTANALYNFVTGDTVQAETMVDTAITKTGGSVSRVITDSEVDHVDVTFSFPEGLLLATDGGRQKPVTIKYRITVQGSGGGDTETEVINSSITKRAYSEFRYQKQIEDIKQYGTAPWTIRCYRTTTDYEDSKAQMFNDLFKWYSYTEIKEVKLSYRRRAVVGTSIEAEDYGDNIPQNRVWKIKGELIKYPSNYTPSGTYPSAYSGVWDGTFSTGFCWNPAWVVYDILTNTTYGRGLDESLVDKWTLYSIAQYCDGEVTYKVNTRQSDGTYLETEVVQKRFTCNVVLSSRENALVVLNHLCSVFAGFPIWSQGLVSFSQDSPTTVSRIASAANVIDGLFTYEGTDLKQRTTVVKVGYNDIENFFRRETVILEDGPGIARYGYNPVDFFAVGCNNRNEAILRGKYFLYTNINQTELVRFKGGIQWADSIPGEIIGVQDPFYAGENWSGRIVSSTTTSITIDHPVTIAPATTYTLYFEQNTDNVTSKVLTNAPGTTSTLTWSGSLTAPQAGNNWIVSSTSLAIRKFRLIAVKENEDNTFDIVAAEYDANKYSLVEENVVVEVPIPTTQPVGILDPPTNITVESYSYLEGDSKNRKYAMRIDWTASADVRTQYYEIKYKKNDGQLEDLDITGDTSYVWEDVDAGTYDIYVRAKSLTARSSWLIYADFVMINETGNPNAPTNLRTSEGGEIFSGKDCHMVWDAPTDSTSIYDSYVDSSGVEIFVYSGNTGKIRDYKIEVYDTDTLTLRRTAFSGAENIREFIYTYEMNQEDFSGVPERNLTFMVYTVGLDALVSDDITRAVSNPAPDMSSTLPVITPRPKYLEVEWALNTDNDMQKYVILCDTNNPPTTEVGSVVHPVNRFEVFNVTYGTTYYVKVVPYDLFGVGVASQVPGGESPLIIPSIDIDVELSASITKTYSDATGYTGDIETLYNRDFDSDGISMDNPVDQYIKYSYGREDYFDRTAIWCSNANPQVYISYSLDDSTWYYLKAEADHTPDASGALIAASNEADAITNYWQLESGFNTALWPNNIVSRYVRLHFVNTNETQIYEFVPSRIVISELAAIESLSAISANIGTIINGVIQTDDYSASQGFKIDMDDKSIFLGGSSTPVMHFYRSGAINYLDITATVTFASGSTGYQNILDKPDSLSDINTGEGTALGHVSAWRHPSSITKIDGGDLYVGSRILLNEGGRATFGNSNVVIDTAGNHGSIVVAPDGGPASHNYCHLDEGDIKFYYWNGSTHLLYASMSRMESGIASANAVVTLPGVWKEQPEILLSPNTLSCYKASYSNQDQALQCYPTSITKTGLTYKFTATAQLGLAAGSVGGTGTGITTSTTTDFYTPEKALATNTRKIVVTVKGQGYKWVSSELPEDHTFRKYFQISTYTMYLYYYVNGAWKTLSAVHTANTSLDHTQTQTFTFTTETESYNITKYKCRYVHSAYKVNSTDSIYTGATNQGNGTLFTINNTGYTSNLVGSTALATGTVSWIAVGR